MPCLALDDALVVVAEADAATLADAESPEHAAALEALTRLSDALAAAAQALAVLPTSGQPELRAALADLVSEAQELVDDLTARVEAGDEGGIQVAIDRAAELRTQTGAILATIDAMGDIGCPDPSAAPSGGPIVLPTREPAPTEEPSRPADPGARANAEPDSEPDAIADADAERPDAEPDAHRPRRARHPADAIAHAEPDARRPTPSPSAHRPRRARAQPHAEPDATPTPSPSPTPDAEPEPDPDADPEPHAHAEPHADADPIAHAEPYADTDPDPHGVRGAGRYRPRAGRAFNPRDRGPAGARHRSPGRGRRLAGRLVSQPAAGGLTMPMLDRIRSAIGGVAGPSAEVMTFHGPEPCEECGGTPADDLVGVRWLCGGCAPAARRDEYADQAGRADAGVSQSTGPG